MIVVGRQGYKLDLLLKTKTHLILPMQSKAARVMDERLLPITIPIKDE
jgi:hypothetical protein